MYRNFYSLMGIRKKQVQTKIVYPVQSNDWLQLQSLIQSKPFLFSQGLGGLSGGRVHAGVPCFALPLPLLKTAVLSPSGTGHGGERGAAGGAVVVCSRYLQAQQTARAAALSFASQASFLGPLAAVPSL